MAKEATQAAGADLTAILARLDALEADRKADFDRAMKDGEIIADLKAHVEALAKTVDGHTEILANETARLMDGELAAGELVEGYDPRGEVLKLHHQVEAMANHLNFRLPG